MELPTGEVVLSPWPYHYAFLLHSPETLSPRAAPCLRRWQALCWFGAGSPSCSGLVPVGIPQALLPSDLLCHWEGPYGENGSSAVFLEIMPARRRAPGSPRPAGKGPELGHLASLLKAIVKGQGFLGEVPGYQGWHGESLMPRKGSSSRKPSCTALLGSLPGLVLLPCGPRFLPSGPHFWQEK